MQYLVKEILELIRLASTDLPAEVENKILQAAQVEEPSSAARNNLETILRNIRLARQNQTPLCQDTGTPIFYVKKPQEWRQTEIIKQIRLAVEKATRLFYLRPNAVDALTGENSGSNLGDKYFPEIHCEEIEKGNLEIELVLKGGGCENMGAQFALPNSELGAERCLEGVRRCALDAVWRAQGEGCAPGFLGIAVGGDRGTSFLASKEALLHIFNPSSSNSELTTLEERITAEANTLSIGPMGVGGKTTLLGTSITSLHRVPASYLVSISYMCWAFRRRKMIVYENGITYE